MNARFIKLWNDLQSSYYFIPGLMAFAAVLLAMITSHIDKSWDHKLAEQFGWFYSNKADGARAILMTIAGSMMTVASVTFSITMVAVTSAAGQYGPRLIGNFMRDRANQFTLGMFTSTFVYCLLILRIARTGDVGAAENAVQEFVPNVSLLVAMCLTMLSVGVMIFFIHHIPETLNVGNITGRVGRKLRKDIQAAYLDEENQSFSVEDPSDGKYALEHGTEIPSVTEGYIQAVNESAIMEWAARHDAVVRLQYRPGDFAIFGDPLMYVWKSDLSDVSISEEATRKLRSAYAMGQERTAHQNILFLADELVEILARALSPGVNDPFTAINCINWFQSAIRAIMLANMPSAYRRDASGEIRVILHPVSFERFVSVICDQSRAYIATDRNTTLKMLTVLKDLVSQARTRDQRRILIDQIHKLKLAALESLPSRIEKQDIKAEFMKIDNIVKGLENFSD
jgi:uncharacterized membrane protein